MIDKSIATKQRELNIYIESKLQTKLKSQTKINAFPIGAIASKGAKGRLRSFGNKVNIH